MLHSSKIAPAGGDGHMAAGEPIISGIKEAAGHFAKPSRIRGSILETVGNTPVVRINKLAPEGVELYVKLEAFNPLGSVKDRLALGVIEAAERDGTLKPQQTVIEATSGNTG